MRILFTARVLSLLRWVETGSKRWYAAMWIAFLLGFGALELNVVFPALAAGLSAAVCAPRYLPGIAPMFLVSLGYALSIAEPPEAMSRPRMP